MIRIQPALKDNSSTSVVFWGQPRDDDGYETIEEYIDDLENRGLTVFPPGSNDNVACPEGCSRGSLVGWRHENGPIFLEMVYEISVRAT